MAQNGDAQNDEAPHVALLTRDVRRFLERPAAPYGAPPVPTAPPGAPIGEPAMDWLGGFSFGSTSTGALVSAWYQQFPVWDCDVEARF
jgi:hypothetical protein